MPTVTHWQVKHPSFFCWEFAAAFLDSLWFGKHFGGKRQEDSWNFAKCRRSPTALLLVWLRLTHDTINNCLIPRLTINTQRWPAQRSVQRMQKIIAKYSKPGLTYLAISYVIQVHCKLGKWKIRLSKTLLRPFWGWSYGFFPKESLVCPCADFLLPSMVVF